jgi:hypothetical protein
MPDPLSQSPEANHAFSIDITPSHSPKARQDFGMDVTLPPSQEIIDDFRMRATLSPSPVQEHEINSVIEEPIGTYPPTEAEEPSGSSSKARSKFHIASSHIHLTPVHAVWKWGEPAPSPVNSGQAILREQRNVYENLHYHLSEIYMSEGRVSDALDSMIVALEDA